jgi:hypothetical protein
VGRSPSRDDAAKESNLPSRGLPGPASFEDWMGHQARAAPAVRLRSGTTRPPAGGGTSRNHRAGAWRLAGRGQTTASELGAPKASLGVRPE